MFLGRGQELVELEDLYVQDQFQLFILYGRRRVGKTTLLNEFCKKKDVNGGRFPRSQNIFGRCLLFKQ